VFKAIGQTFVPTPLKNGSGDMLELTNSGRIAVNDDRQTSLSDVWAGGDCVPGDDLTVAAVQDGKLAAHAIDRALRG
jgi:glutamate synthase (NADPH/NADH) small chain